MIRKLLVSLAFFLPLWLFATPENPTNLQLHALSANSVSITWEDQAVDETGYKIYRNNQLITIAPVNATGYIDTGLTAATSYNYTVKATDDLAKVTVDNASIAPNEEIIISFNNTPGNKNDWIGIYPKGSNNDWGNVVAWFFTNNTKDTTVAGSVNGSITFAPLPKGEYEARLFYNNSFNLESLVRFKVEDKIVGPTLTSNKTLYTAQESISVNFTNLPANKDDWIAIYPKGSSNEWENVITWYFTNGTRDTDLAGVANGTLTFEPLVAGEYEARLFYNNSFNLEKSISFNVAQADDSVKVFIIGDSTVHNRDPELMGWGSQLGAYTKDNVTVYNQARSGSSSKSYQVNIDAYNHDWPHTKALIEEANINNGAYLLIQFGHNDEDADAFTHTDPDRGNSFYTNLKFYIDEARAMGVTPVLITPVSRLWKYASGHVKNGDYPQTVRDLATDEHVILLDLYDISWHEFSSDKYIDHDAVVAAWGVPGKDHTHFSPQGAYKVAAWIKELMCAQDQSLCNLFK